MLAVPIDPMSVIRSLEVLAHDYLPPRLLCRETEYGELAMELKLMMSGFPPPKMILLGPPGTGKTVTIKKVLSDLRVPYAYVVAESSAFKTLVALQSSIIGKRRWGPSLTMVWDEVDKALRHRNR